MSTKATAAVAGTELQNSIPTNSKLGTHPPVAANSPKAAHYNSALSAALLKGAWTDQNAGKAPNGTELSWNELIRKWGKHTGGNTALIHHLRNISILYSAPTCYPVSSSNYITAAHSPQSPTSPISPVGPSDAQSSVASPEQSSPTGLSSSQIRIPHPHLGLHRPANGEASKEPSGSGTGPVGKELSHVVSSPRSAGKSKERDDGPAEEAWSSDSAWWSGVRLDQVDQVKAGILGLENEISSGNLSPPEIRTAKIILTQHLSAIGKHVEVLDVASTLETIERDTTGILPGDASVMELIRLACYKGISKELLSPSTPETAIDTYTSTAQFASSLSSSPSLIPTYLDTSKISRLPFEGYQDVHRYLSTSLSRAAVLSAHQNDGIQTCLRILRSYHALSQRSPASFRPYQRQRMLLLYLRALYSGHPPAGSLCSTPYLVDESFVPPASDARIIWRKEVADVLKIGRALLGATMAFPRAGTVNHPVIALTEITAALADKCPFLDRDAISVMWWAMTVTFQSQSILRHLSRLLSSVGEYEDARRVFETYVKLVLKSRETQQPEVSLQLKRRPTEDSAASPIEIHQERFEKEQTGDGDAQGEVERKGGEFAEAEVDGDHDFVGALLVGSRLLLRNLGDAEEAWRYACLAGDVIADAKKNRRMPFSGGLLAEVEECKGIVRMAMGIRGADPLTRPTYQAQSLNHLSAATSLNPTSTTAFYHLAYCQAEARSIDSAIDSIRRAIELESKNIQSWHLLALLLTAQGDWTAAAKAGEAGINVWEQEEEREMAEEEGITLNGTGEGGNPDENNPTIEAKDYAGANGQSEQPNQTPKVPRVSIQSTEALLFPSGSFKPAKVMAKPTIPPPVNRVMRLEQVIRLRMTINIIVEKLQGPEIAMARQQELFSFFSMRSGKNRGQAVPVTRAIPGSTSVMSFGMGNAGPSGGVEAKSIDGSFVNLNLDDDQPLAGDMESSVVAVQPPTPNLDENFIPATPPSPRTSVEGSTGMSPSPSTSDTDAPRSSRQKSPVQFQMPPNVKRRSLSSSKSFQGTKKLVAKHLHVPHPSKERGGLTRKISQTGQLRISAQRNRAASTTSTTAFSVAPTAVHSHFRGQMGHSPTPPPPPIQAVDHGRTPAESRILSTLWLMSAATFRRWGKLEQCLVAIEEAETLDPENNLVWIQLGLYHCALSPPDTEKALPAFTKAILLKPDHPPGIICLSKLYLSIGQVDLAHNLLNQITQDVGWDSSEAWYYLGKVCEVQGREERARECWKYALSLEESKPAMRWSESVDRWL